MSDITLTGIGTMEGGTGKVIAYFDITYNSITYHWFDYVEVLDGSAAMTYLNSHKATYESDIDAKEATWVTCPKTRTIKNFMNEDVVVDVTKDEIVCATPSKPKTVEERLKDLENP